MADNGAPGACLYRPQGHGRIYKEDHYTLLHTKCESSGPCCFGGEDLFFLCFSHSKAMEANGPRGGVIFYPKAYNWQDLCKALHNNAAYKI